MKFKKKVIICFSIIVIYTSINIIRELHTIAQESETTLGKDKSYVERFEALKYELNKYHSYDPELFQLVLKRMKQEGKLNKDENCTKKSDLDFAVFKPTDIQHGAAAFNDSTFKADDYLSEVPVIPQIIHQLWHSRQIPGLLKPWIRSIVKHHPYWKYWFWTLDDVECLIKMNYPSQLYMFQSYKKDEFKAVASRYFILHSYGGIFMDLDTEVLKPMDFWTYKYPAVLSYENYEHSYLVKKQKHPNLMYGVIASMPQHPFLLMLTTGLEQYSRVKDIDQAAGNTYLHYMYESYIRSDIHRADKNLVMTIHPKYWYPKWDPTIHYLSTACNNGIQLGSLNEHAIDLCDKLEENDFVYHVTKESFLNYHWMHVYSWEDRKKRLSTFDIVEVIPYVKLASSFIDCIGDA